MKKFIRLENTADSERGCTLFVRNNAGKLSSVAVRKQNIPMGFTHLDTNNKAKMVDISDKKATLRYARARAEMEMKPSTVRMIKNSQMRKGDVLTTAKIAAIMAAKKTCHLIPLTHPIKITGCDVGFFYKKNGITIETEVKVFDTTGCEMEALTMASVAGLVIYDMIKSADRNAVIKKIALLEKSGGKSGIWKRR